MVLHELSMRVTSHGGTPSYRMTSLSSFYRSRMPKARKSEAGIQLRSLITKSMAEPLDYEKALSPERFPSFTVRYKNLFPI